MPQLNDTTKSVPVDEKNKSEEIRQFEWMIRPCETYKEEYADCKSIKARFHQYFIFGKSIDCEHWKSDYHDCYRWLKHESLDAAENMIKHEKQRRIERLRGHYENDVWKRRDKPPENWNAPLPDWLQSKCAKSYVMLPNEKNEMSTKKFCTIS